MGMSRLPYITQALIDNGMSSQTPAAVIRWGTTGEQRTQTAPLADLASQVREAGLTPPSLIVIGPAVELRAQLAWWEARPLFGKRVLVTRPRHQVGDMLRRLEVLGAAAEALPMVEIREPAAWSPVDRALADLSHYDWLVFTSANGVHALIRRLRHVGRDLRALGSLQLAAIGPATADALRAYHLEPDLVPARYDSEALAAELRSKVLGKRLLLARADRGRELLREELAHVAAVEQIAVYSQLDAIPSGSPALDALGRGEIDFITVTSSNIARALHRGLDMEARDRIASGSVRLVSISPVTSSALRDFGWPVAGEAREATTTGVIETLIELALNERRKTN
jgi:uroporphyrinogen III methyltransferase/synthase